MEWQFLVGCLPPPILVFLIRWVKLSSALASKFKGHCIVIFESNF